MSDKIVLTPEQATELLPEGENIHTFVQGGPMLVGADWSREAVLAHFNISECIEVAGPAAMRMRHGIAATSERRTVFIECDMAKMTAAGYVD